MGAKNGGSPWGLSSDKTKSTRTVVTLATVFEYTDFPLPGLMAAI